MKKWQLDLPPLHYCCREGYIECIRYLISGVNLNRDTRSGSPLYLASYGGNAKTVCLLADVNLVGGSYGSALATASFWGKAEIIHLLLENDADVNLVCGKYGSALPLHPTSATRRSYTFFWRKVPMST
jgi:ankyrin repeat protein